MGKLHDDLLQRTKALLESAKQTVAVGTETQQQMADVYQQLDQANELLKQFIADNAATGSSSGGSEQLREQEQDRAINRARGKPAAEDGWKA